MGTIVLYTSGNLRLTKITGGVRRFLELLNELPNHEKVILMSGDEEYPVGKNCKHISMHQSKKYNKEFYYAIHNLPYLRKLKKQSYDTIIVFDVPPAIWLALFRIPRITLMLRKDLIEYEKIRLSDEKVSDFKKNIKLAALKIAETITISHAERIIVQCNFDKDNLLKRHPFIRKNIKKKIKVQINNVNPSWAKATDPGSKVNNDQFTVATVSDFSNTRKGFDIFLEAVASLIDDGLEIRGLLAGDGKLLKEYQKKYEKYKDIQFYGRISDPSMFISKVDLAVVPSKADSCPNTIMEALYNHVPVIGARAGGIPEILNNNDALFDLNGKSLKQKIELYMNDQNREKLRLMQKDRTDELEFDWVRKIYELLQ